MTTTKNKLDIQIDESVSEYSFIDKTEVDNLSKIISNIEEILHSEISSTLEVREKQYTDFREYISSYGRVLGDTKFNLSLTRDEYLYLKKLILKNLEYDRQNLFIGLLVKNDFFKKYDNKDTVSDTSLYSLLKTETFKLNITEITRISHLTSLNKIHGLDKEADIFSHIIRKIGEISKIVELYDNKGKQLSESGNNWIQGFAKYDDIQKEIVNQSNSN